ncbi:MAG: transcription elongation factor Spt5 [Thermoprotei archaeon]|nr:MAG: transcription elongation factor Spt5 [Thermoprotei archaeon]
MSESSGSGTTATKRRSLQQRSQFFAVRTTARQEMNVALLIENRVRNRNLAVYSIIVPSELRGYIILETAGLHVVYEAIRDMKHVKGRASGALKWDDVEKLLKPKPIIEQLSVGEEVEIVAGPFRGLRARVVEINKARNEVVLNILEASFPLNVTVPVEYVKPAKKV